VIVIDPKGPLPYFQEAGTKVCPQPAESCPHYHSLLL